MPLPHAFAFSLQMMKLRHKASFNTIQQARNQYMFLLSCLALQPHPITFLGFPYLPSDNRSGPGDKTAFPFLRSACAGCSGGSGLISPVGPM